MRSSQLYVGMLLLFEFALVASPASSRADYIPPPEVSVKTESYEPGRTDFQLGTYVYDVKWQGIPVGATAVVVSRKDIEGRQYFSVQAFAQSGRVIDVFYRLRHQTTSLFRADSIRPFKYSMNQFENSTEKKAAIEFGQEGRIQSENSKNNKVPEKFDFKSDNLTLDPVTAGFLALSLDFSPGSARQFDVFNGKHRYLITLKAETTEDIKVKGNKVSALRISPSVAKLTDTKGEKRVKYAAVWIPADKTKQVLRLESRVLVGKISAQLSDYFPAGSELPPRIANLTAGMPAE